jgi:tartrate/fumarate subfamily iron-sulfur-dependent hydro-lyase alpha chain
VKEGFASLAAKETGATAQSVLGTMIRNISVAEATDNLLCQDTGIPIYNVTVGRGVQFDDGDGTALKASIRKGCERATREHPLRSSIVHPLTRKNEHTSCGIGVPVINIDHGDDVDGVRVEMIPKGSGSENNSWLKMALPAEGVDAIKTFVIDCVLAAGGKTCPPTIIGVGVIDMDHRNTDAARGVFVLARQWMHDRRAQRMLARRTLAALAYRCLERGAVAVAELHAAADGHVVDRDPRILAEQVVGRLRNRDVLDHRAQNVLCRRRRLLCRERVEAALDVGRQDLERPDVELLGDVLDRFRVDAHGVPVRA